MFGFLSRTFTATKCGHKTKSKGCVKAFGVNITMKMPLEDDGTVKWCLECIGKMTILCAWCGNPIFIGSPITLYSPRNEKKFKVPEHAHVYREKPLTLVGCLGWECAETGADRAGFWLPGDDGKGFVYRVKTAYEMISEVKKDTIVIIHDMDDLTEAQKPTTITHA